MIVYEGGPANVSRLVVEEVFNPSLTNTQLENVLSVENGGGILQLRTSTAHVEAN